MEEKPDPKTFRPDLYQAAMKNDTNSVMQFLRDQVPCDYIDPKTSYTVSHISQISSRRCKMYTAFWICHSDHSI